MLSTIQFQKDEEQFILQLKNLLGFETKKAVVLAGLKVLEGAYQEKLRKERLQKASLSCRGESLKINQEMAPHSFFITHDSD